MAPKPPYRPRLGRPRGAGARRAYRRPRALALGAVLAAVLTATVAAGVASGSLEGRISSARTRAGQLSAGIAADSRQIQGFGGRIEDLRARLHALELSLGVERAFLGSLRAQLASRSEEHTSELQSPYDLVCRLLLEKKKETDIN